MADTSDVTRVLTGITGLANTANKTTKAVTTLGNNTDKLIGTAGKLAGVGSGAKSGKATASYGSGRTAGKQAPAPAGNQPALPDNTTPMTNADGYPDYDVLGSMVVDQNGKRYFKNAAPNGTRFIIPRSFSSTGKERYLGANALESIMNLRDGKPNCGNIIVLGPDNKPSQYLYDQGPNGEIFLKGTQEKISINADGDNASVRLTEQEFACAVKALQDTTSEKTYFKTNQANGNAENSTATAGSWFSRNWWKILLGLVIAGGIAWGGIEILNHRKESKAKKADALAKAASSTPTNELQQAAVSTATQAKSFSATKITQEATNDVQTRLVGKEL